MTQFYQAMASMAVLHSDDQHAVLEVQGFQLVVHAIRGATPADGHPIVREDSFVKLCFPVDSIAAARTTASALGGSVKADRDAFEARGFRACDGHDPEGNVFQVRETAV